MASFGQVVNSANLTTTFVEYTFTLATAYTIQAGDRILVEYSGPASIQLDVWADKFDGSATRRISFTNIYAGSSTLDIVGSFVYCLTRRILVNLFNAKYFSLASIRAVPHGPNIFCSMVYKVIIKCCKITNNIALLASIVQTRVSLLP